MSKTFSLGFLFLLTACAAVGPDYQKPTPEMAANYHAQLARNLKALPNEVSAWWEQLNDPVLSELINETAEANLDLRQAWSRINEARARRGIAATERWPTVDIDGNYGRTQNSLEIPGGDFLPRGVDNFSTGFSAGWELDLWGRIARNIEAADAESQVSLEDYRDVLTTMVAETAMNYVELRGFQERLRIARSNVEIQAQTVALSDTRFRSGLVSQLDVAQAKTLLESTRATIPPLASGVEAASNRLAVLTGKRPGSLGKRFENVRPIPVGDVELAVGVPADLLRRRADIRRAERQLAAQTARIGVAEAELYPKFSLFGTIGLSSEDFANFFKRSAANFSFGPQFSFNVFDRDRLRAAVQVENSRQEQSLLNYEKSILLALEEVENTMVSFVNEQLRRDSLQRAVVESRRSLDLSRDQYRQGLVDFQGVLESQRTLFSLEDQLTLNHAAITTAMIRLYKALGGGWEHFEPKNKITPKTIMEKSQ